MKKEILNEIDAEIQRGLKVRSDEEILPLVDLEIDVYESESDREILNLISEFDGDYPEFNLGPLVWPYLTGDK